MGCLGGVSLACYSIYVLSNQFTTTTLSVDLKQGMHTANVHAEWIQEANHIRDFAQTSATTFSTLTSRVERDIFQTSFHAIKLLTKQFAHHISYMSQ